MMNWGRGGAQETVVTLYVLCGKDWYSLCSANTWIIDDDNSPLLEWNDAKRSLICSENLWLFQVLLQQQTKKRERMNALARQAYRDICKNHKNRHNESRLGGELVPVMLSLSLLRKILFKEKKRWIESIRNTSGCRRLTVFCILYKTLE